jgi:hypothetical protein
MRSHSTSLLLLLAAGCGSLGFWPYARMSLVGTVLLLGIAVAGIVPGLGGKRHSLW